MIETVRGRLTLWYVTALALVLAVFSVTFYFLLSSSLHTRVDHGLESAIEIATRSLTNDLDEGQSVQSAALSTVAELSNPMQTLMVYDASRNLLADNIDEGGFRASLPESDQLGTDEIFIATIFDSARSTRHRIAVRRVVISKKQIAYYILAGQSLKPVEDELESLREPLFLAGPAALFLAGLGGWFLARKSLAPVVDMAGTARRLGATNLGQLPVANPRDELGQLAITFNELLGRLQAAFAQQRQFMADASHELRTPLSVMNTAAGVTLKKPHREESEYREAIQMMGEQTHRLSQIVKDMLTLARADSGSLPVVKTLISLSALLEDVVRSGRLLAVEKEVSIKLDHPPQADFFGDGELLRRLLLNLIDNAIKYSPPRGVVAVKLVRDAHEYRISVSDQGPGIPAEDQKRIFERFYRVDRARSAAEDSPASAGLGLAIASWIALAHEGHLEVGSSDATGTTFVARFPVLSMTDNET